MKSDEASLLMNCHLAGLPGVEDARIVKSVRAAEKDAALRGELHRQKALDERCVGTMERVMLPPALLARIAAARMPASQPFAGKAALRQPAVLSILIGALVMLGWGGYTLYLKAHSFPGKDDVIQMVDVNDEMTGMEMVPKNGKVGALDDWYFSRYGFEDFYVPPGFGDYTVVGARLFKQDGMPVAQVAVEEHSMVFYSFKADDFGVQADPKDAWHILEDGDWVAALWQHDEECFMVAFRGTQAEMQDFLAKQKK